MDEETRRIHRLLSGGKLSGPEAEEILANVLAAVGGPTVLELSCTPGTLAACPRSASLVFSASGGRAANFLSAYAEPLAPDAEPVFYFSEEDGSPKLAQPAKGERSEYTLALPAAHPLGRYRVHAFLAAYPLEREEMIDGVPDTSSIAARVQVEIVFVG
jgi:hypothetical protein